jgi:hypothetical protein
VVWRPKVASTLRKRGRRRWEAVVIVANPRSGSARASQVGFIFPRGVNIVRFATRTSLS